MRIKQIVIILIYAIALSGCYRDTGREMSGFADVGFFKKNENSANTQAYDLPETGIKIGMTAPDFEIIMLNGKPMGMLSDLRGKPVIVNFWASWCGPCVVEMPAINEINEKYNERLSIIAVNVGETAETVQYFFDQNEYGFQFALDPEQTVSAAYMIQSIPQTFVIDENGIIVSHIPYSTDTETLEEAFLNLLTD